MSNPGNRGWGPGWPNCQTGNVVTLKRADGLKLPIHRRIAPIVAHLMDETERLGYDIRPGETWGFACRAIRGSNSPSYHSWALSVDINAPHNPMLYGSPGWQWLHDHHRTDMPSWMPGLWGSMMFGWGGNYPSRQDAMHYEFMGTPADADRIVASILRGNAPVSINQYLPIKLHRGTASDPYTSNMLIGSIQKDLNKFNAKNKTAPILKIDGVYGKDTAAAIVAFKKWNIALQKALSLPVWPDASTTIGPITYGALQFWTQ